jgi:hypothetical protein
MRNPISFNNINLTNSTYRNSRVSSVEKLFSPRPDEGEGEF